MTHFKESERENKKDSLNPNHDYGLLVKIWKENMTKISLRQWGVMILFSSAGDSWWETLGWHPKESWVGKKSENVSY